MTNITQAEAHVLDAIAHHEYTTINGATPTSKEEHGGTFMHLEDFTPPGWTVQQTKGVISSLVQKGLIITHNDGEDDLVDFTPAGFDAWRSLAPRAK